MEIFLSKIESLVSSFYEKICDECYSKKFASFLKVIILLENFRIAASWGDQAEGAFQVFKTSKTFTRW